MIQLAFPRRQNPVFIPNPSLLPLPPIEEWPSLGNIIFNSEAHCQCIRYLPPDLNRIFTAEKLSFALWWLRACSPEAIVSSPSPVALIPYDDEEEEALCIKQRLRHHWLHLHATLNVCCYCGYDAPYADVAAMPSFACHQLNLITSAVIHRLEAYEYFSQGLLHLSLHSTSSQFDLPSGVLIL